MVLVLNPIWVDCIWRSFAFLLTFYLERACNISFNHSNGFYGLKKHCFCAKNSMVLFICL